MLLISGYEGREGGEGGAEGAQGDGGGAVGRCCHVLHLGDYHALYSHNYSPYALKPHANFAA